MKYLNTLLGNLLCIIYNLWVAKKNSHTHTCAHTSTCAMCVRNKVWNVRAMCVRARPLGDLRVAIATSQLCFIKIAYRLYNLDKISRWKKILGAKLLFKIFFLSHFHFFQVCKTWNFSNVWNRPWFFKNLILRNLGAY